MDLPAEVIGAGYLWDGLHPLPAGSEHPPPFPRGTFVGEHLSVERLLRVVDRRMIYLVHNLSRKWSRRKCWACGNAYSPNKAQSCTFCGTPLRDLRFLMTARWDVRLHAPFEALVQERVRHFGLVTPVALIYRRQQMMAVYHYHGEGLLLDEPSPLRARVILGMAYQLADALAFLHGSGVVLRPFDAANVLVMPDGTVRWFDLDVERLAGGAEALYRDPTLPPARDTRRLASMLLRYCGPEDEELAGFLQRAAMGGFPGPQPFLEAVRQLLRRYDFDGRRTIAAAYTDLGLARERNEDLWGWRRISGDTTAYAVADGTGGPGRGDTAARLAIDTAFEALTNGFPDAGPAPGALEKLLDNAVRRSNDAVRAHQRSQQAMLGSSLVLALVGGDRLTLAHAGNARAYLHRDGALEPLTEDDSVVGHLLATGQLARDDARRHPKTNVLTSFLGADDAVDPHVRQIPLRRGDRLLLCTDGLWREIGEPEIGDILARSANRRRAIRELVRSAYREGGSDNLAVEVIDV